jgi:hypothetical protein
MGSVSCSGVPLCDDYSILSIRLATADGRVRYHDLTKQRSSMEDLGSARAVKVNFATISSSSCSLAVLTFSARSRDNRKTVIDRGFENVSKAGVVYQFVRSTKRLHRLPRHSEGSRWEQTPSKA